MSLPTPAEIASAGPWAVLAFCLIAGIVGISIAFVKQIVVPGWIYRQEREQREKAETQALRNAEAIEKLTRAVNRDRARPGSSGGP